MQRLTILAHLRGEADPPSGEPLQTRPRAASVSVDASAADGSDAAIRSIAYENHATFTGETTVTETGTITVDDGDLDIVSIGDGTLVPSADVELLHGTAMYRIVEGRRT